MKHIRIILISLIAIALTVAIIQHISHEAEKEQDTEQTLQERPSGLVGSDRDTHGCIRSAGYIWSELLQDCIRPFEQGIRLVPEEDPEAVEVAYLVFNQDGSRVEVFLPREDKHPILHREIIGVDDAVWLSADEGMDRTTGGRAPVVRKLRDKWSILIGERIAFIEP